MKKSLGILGLTLILAIGMNACKKNSDITNISSNGKNESHNMGQNCMDCHKVGGDGKGAFKAAGTVYNSGLTAELPNVKVKLFTGPNGTGSLAHVIEVDAKGNFYTTESIDFSKGLYPSVETGNGSLYMSTTAANGMCNSCHGVSTTKLYGQ